MSAHPRVNEKGQFCPLPGTTVISAIQESDLQFWREVYDQLKKSPTICQYYALLPPRSYHMTGISLDTIDDLPENEDWIAFIDKKILSYSALYNALSVQPISPQIKFDFLSELNLIVLHVELSSEQKSKIQKLAEQHNCSSGVPISFHITLAYQYNKNLTDEDYDKIDTELTSLRDMFKGKRTTLSPLKLCYFDDMTRFTPWDGTTNPFIPFLSSYFYRFYNTVKIVGERLCCNNNLFNNNDTVLPLPSENGCVSKMS